MTRFPNETEERRPARNDLFRAGTALRLQTADVAEQRSVIDGIDGIVRHVRQRIELAVVAKAPIERFAAHARSRGWQSLCLLSSSGTTFTRDYAAENDDEEQCAIATVFTRRDGRVHRMPSLEYRGA